MGNGSSSEIRTTSRSSRSRLATHPALRALQLDAWRTHFDSLSHQVEQLADAVADAKVGANRKGLGRVTASAGGVGHRQARGLSEEILQRQASLDAAQPPPRRVQRSLHPPHRTTRSTPLGGGKGGHRRERKTHRPHLGKLVALEPLQGVLQLLAGLELFAHHQVHEVLLQDTVDPGGVLRAVCRGAQRAGLTPRLVGPRGELHEDGLDDGVGAVRLPVAARVRPGRQGCRCA